MNLLTMLARLFLPIGNGAFIETKGGDNRLKRTVMSQQDQDFDHEV